MKNLLLFVLALTALPALASKWECVPLKESNILSYKAKCNQLRQVEFTKIRIHMDGKVSYLGFNSATAFCASMGMEWVDSFDDDHFSSIFDHTFHKKARYMEQENGRIYFSKIRKSRFTARKIICGEPRPIDPNNG